MENETQKTEKKSGLFWLEKLGMKTHNRKFWNSDKLLSLFAFLISVGTFVTFAYQTYLIREQQDLILKEQYASVLPYLTIYPWREGPPGSGDLSINLINNGLGPAFIKDVKVHYEEKTYNLDHVKFISKFIFPHNPINYGSREIPVGFVVPAGQKYVLLQSNDAKAEEVIGDLFAGSDPPKVIIEITYSSVYDETWVIKSSNYVPEKLE